MDNHTPSPPLPFTLLLTQPLPESEIHDTPMRFSEEEQEAESTLSDPCKNQVDSPKANLMRVNDANVTNDNTPSNIVNTEQNHVSRSQSFPFISLQARRRQMSPHLDRPYVPSPLSISIQHSPISSNSSGNPNSTKWAESPDFVFPDPDPSSSSIGSSRSQTHSLPHKNVKTAPVVISPPMLHHSSPTVPRSNPQPAIYRQHHPLYTARPSLSPVFAQTQVALAKAQPNLPGATNNSKPINSNEFHPRNRPTQNPRYFRFPQYRPFSPTGSSRPSTAVHSTFPRHRRHLSESSLSPLQTPVRHLTRSKSYSHQSKRPRLHSPMDIHNQSLFNDESIEALLSAGSQLDDLAQTNDFTGSFIGTSSSGISGMIGMPTQQNSANEGGIPSLLFDSVVEPTSLVDNTQRPGNSLFSSNETFTTFRDSEASFDEEVSALFSPELSTTTSVTPNLETTILNNALRRTPQTPFLEPKKPAHFLSVPSDKRRQHPLLNELEELNMIDHSNANIIQFPSPFIPFIPSPLSSPLFTFGGAHRLMNSIPGQSLNDMTSFLDTSGLLNGSQGAQKSLDEMLQEQGLGYESSTDHSISGTNSGLFDGTSSSTENDLFSPTSMASSLVNSASIQSIPSVVTSLNDISSNSGSNPQPGSPSQSNLLSPPLSRLQRRSSNGNLVSPTSPNVIRHARSRSTSHAAGAGQAFQNTVSAASGSGSGTRPALKGRSTQPSQPDPLLKDMLGMEGVHESVPQGRFWKTIKDENYKTLYQCPFPACGKTFTRPYNLKSHYRQHTGERPFVCEECGSSFARKHDLKRHQNLHQGLKPHVCPSCKKGFARGDALKRHLKPTDTGKESACALKLKLIENVARQHLTRLLAGQDTTSQGDVVFDHASYFAPSSTRDNLDTLFETNEGSPASDARVGQEPQTPNQTNYLQDMIESIQKLQQGVYDDELVQKMLNGEYNDLLAFAEKDI